jgi:hypothetical protein
MRAAAAAAREKGFPGDDDRGTLGSMDPETRLSLVQALAALPLLAFLPLVLATLLVPLRIRRDQRR